MPFPQDRLRRLRATAGFRRLVRETRLSVDNLIAPFFVMEGRDVRQPIGAMPGQWRGVPGCLIQEAGGGRPPGGAGLLFFWVPPPPDGARREAGGGGGGFPRVPSLPFCAKFPPCLGRAVGGGGAPPPKVGGPPVLPDGSGQPA